VFFVALVQDFNVGSAFRSVLAESRGEPELLAR
jgi:hypothetical protein